MMSYTKANGLPKSLIRASGDGIKLSINLKILPPG
jgi:hypothetical protein